MYFRIGKPVTPERAQDAFERPRPRNPALWESARGEYAVDDAAMHEWCQQRVADQKWPPVAVKVGQR